MSEAEPPVLLCRRAFPKQLSIPEISLISKYVHLDECRHWSLISIYFKLIRETDCMFSAKTFYKYVHILDLRKKQKKIRKRSVGPRAVKPLEILHMDITEYWITDSIRLYAHVLMDNFSRKILGIRLGLTKSDSLAFENLYEAYARFKLHLQSHIIVVMSDGGGENFGKTKEFILSKPNLKQHIALRNKSDCTNNMVEALIKKLKECYMYDYSFSSVENFETHIHNAMLLYNSTMPLAAIDGCTPNEAFEGILPPFAYKFTMEHVSIVTQQRIANNLNGWCR